MRPRRSAAAVLAAVALLVLPVRHAFAGAWSLAPGEYNAEISGGTFSSGTMHDADGNRVALSTPGLYENRTGRARVELGWKKHLSVQLAMPFTSATLAPSASTLSRTQTGLGDLDFGLRWKFANGTSGTALQFGWRAPLGYDRRFQPGVADGYTPGAPAGLEALSLSLQCGKALGTHGFLEAGGGYSYRYRVIGGRLKEAESATQESFGKRTWADHVIANAALAFWTSDHVQVAGLYDGQLAVDQGDRYPEISMHLVGPRMTYRVDDRLDVFAGSWHTASAKNALHVNEFYAGVAFRQTKLKRNQGFLGGAGR